MPWKPLISLPQAGGLVRLPPWKPLSSLIQAGGLVRVPADAGWTPADIANLAVFLQFSTGNCYVSDGGAASGVGDAVGYVTPLYGTTNAASEATNKPTFRANGLEFDAAGVNRLVLDSDFTGGVMTLYWVVLCDAGSAAAGVLANTVTSAEIANLGGMNIFDDIGGNVVAVAPELDIPILLRLNQPSTGAIFHLRFSALEDLTSSGLDSFSFNLIGGEGALGPGAGNDSTANRYLAIIGVNREITYDSTEDLYIRAWIAANCGATVGEGVIIQNDSSFRDSSFTKLVTVKDTSIVFEGCSGVSEMDLPALTEVFGVASEIKLISCANAASFSAPLLETCEGFVQVEACPNVTSVDLSSLESSYKLYLSDLAVTSLELPSYSGTVGRFEILLNPNLTAVDLGGMTSPTEFFEIGDCPLLASVTANSLNAAVVGDDYWKFYDNAVLATLSLPGLTTVAPTITFETMPALTTLNMANLATIVAAGGIVATGATGITALANVTVSASIACAGAGGVDFTGAPLSVASIDAILAAFNAGKSMPGTGFIGLSGGPNTPTGGAANTDYLALVAAGYTVQINT